jgi:hypothetical protein
MLARALTLTVVLSLSLVGCSSNSGAPPKIVPDPAGGGDAGTITASASSPVIDCAKTCAQRGKKLITGWCKWMPSDDGDTSCQAYCDKHVASWSAAQGSTFAHCAIDNPLCYETIEGCMQGPQK